VNQTKNNHLYHILCFQIDYPHSTGGGQFPVSVNPDLIDPNDYHEDRPSFSSGTNKQAVKEYYPVIFTFFYFDACLQFTGMGNTHF
jgi:hypothetical protein